MEFLMRIPLLHRLFGKAPVDQSRQAARDRLKNALVGDRCTVAPSMSRVMQKELLEVLARYMEVDESSLVLKLEPNGEAMQWTAGVRVESVHRQSHLPEEALQEPQAKKSRPKRSLRGNRWRRSQEDAPSVEEEKSA